ncbi:MAG: alpha-L-fucosidase [Bacteroidales bacterium]|jgi:alpha-L-fucosidase|nr:alpha-L-fucosidase [Bacteroidales bacterium]
MIFRQVFFSLLLISATAGSVIAQYVYPKEPEVLQNLHEWQDLKFGLFMHWGPYSQWGVAESWTLEPTDKGWGERPKDKSYFEYVHEYEGLQKTFNPVNFAPEKWSAAAKAAGMRYVVFTTKHHDGFCMFDTKQHDYKITSAACPFHTNPRSNLTKEIFGAFRNDGFKIGAYYSIIDWHHDDFWWRYFPPTGAKMNYDVKKYPQKLANFQDYMDRQMSELSDGDYGKIDIYWFDYVGCPVDYKRFATTIRKNQPSALLVFRGGGEWENYRTPEQYIPDKALDYPWETCMTLDGNSWCYRPKPDFKSSREVIHNLLLIVSRGGNFLLNIAPGPDGDWHPDAYERLKETGAWMNVNSEAIYGTKAVAPYQETKLVFTQKDKYIYAAYLADEDETHVPAVIAVNSFCPAKGSKVYLLGHSSPLSWAPNGMGFVVRIPASVQKNPPSRHAFVLKFQK